MLLVSFAVAIVVGIIAVGVPHVDIAGDAVCAIVCVALAVIFSVNDCDDICVLS